MSDARPTADEVVASLGMRPHPEGGWFVETWRGEAAAGERAAASTILYLLRAGEESRWHRVDAAEIWQWSGGEALQLRVGSERITLGPDVTNGERVQAVVPPGAWQAARPVGAWTLVGCIVAPAFEYAGFELAPEGWEPDVVR